MNRYYGPILFLSLWLGFQFLGERFLHDPGTFWHITTGEKLLGGELVKHDSYSFTHAGDYWIPHQWLGEIGMALIHRLGGFDAILAVSTALAAGLFAHLGSRFQRLGMHSLFVIALVLLGLAATSNQFHARPLLFTMIGFAITMRALCAFEAGAIRFSTLAWLIPFFALWANIHGGMLGALGTCGFAVFGWAVWKALKWGSPIEDSRTFLLLMMLGVAGVMAALVNPYGLALPRMWQVIMSMPKLPELIIEHARFDIRDPRGWPFLIFGILYVVALCGVKGKPRVVWLLPLLWLAQAMLRVRQGSLFTIVGMVALADLWPHTRWAHWLARKRPDVYTPVVNPRSALPGILATAAVCLAVSLSLQAFKVPVPLIGYGSAKFDREQWPFDLLDELKANEPKSPGTSNRTFNEFAYGGFLIYHTPGYKVFVDDRCELYGDDWLWDFVEASKTEAGTKAAMELWQTKYGTFDFALTERETEFDKYFRARPAEWELVKESQTATFFRRK